MSYACKNRAPFAPSIRVQDGWATSWARNMVDMEFRMDPSCVYSTSDLGQKDKGCEGCKWRKTDDAGRSPETPAVADGAAVDGSIQGPLLAESAGDSARPGDGGTAKPADSGDAEALEQFESKWSSIYRPTEEKGMTDLNELMIKHNISVWQDPCWFDGRYGTQRWLAGLHPRAENGPYYSTLTGMGEASIEADKTASGDTPLEAAMNCMARLEA